MNTQNCIRFCFLEKKLFRLFAKDKFTKMKKIDGKIEYNYRSIKNGIIHCYFLFLQLWYSRF